MKVRLYCVYDKVAKEAGPMFQAKNEAVALRMYQRMAIEQHIDVADYDLMFLGLYDPENMVIQAIPAEVVIPNVNMEVEDE